MKDWQPYQRGADRNLMDERQPEISGLWPIVVLTPFDSNNKTDKPEPAKYYSNLLFEKDTFPYWGFVQQFPREKLHELSKLAKSKIFDEYLFTRQIHPDEHLIFIGSQENRLAEYFPKKTDSREQTGFSPSMAWDFYLSYASGEATVHALCTTGSEDPCPFAYSFVVEPDGDLTVETLARQGQSAFIIPKIARQNLTRLCRAWRLLD